MDMEDLIFIVFMSLFVVVSATLNVIIILVVATNKRMQNVTYMLITNLAVSDLLFVVAVLPQNMHDITHSGDFYEGEFACKTVNFLPLFFIANATYCLVTLSWERYRAIAKSSEAQFNMRSCRYLVAGTWILACLVAMPTLIEYRVSWQTDHHGNNNVTWLSCSNRGTSQHFIMFNTFLVIMTMYLIPFCVMICNYSRVVMYLCHVSKRVMSDSGTSTNNNFVIQRKRLRVVAMLVTVTVLFGLSWLPYFTVFLIAKMTDHSDSTQNDTIWFEARLALAVFSTIYNFVLYLTFSSQFKKGLTTLIENARSYFMSAVAETPVNKSTISQCSGTVC